MLPRPLVPAVGVLTLGTRVRLAACLLAIAVFFPSCGDDGGVSAAKSTTAAAPTSTTGAACSPAPALPPAVDGSAAEVLATVGQVRIAVVDHGASVDVVSLFIERDCALQPATIDGGPAAFPIGGTVTHGDGLVCKDDRFQVLTASSDDGVTYQATSTTYRLDGSALVQLDTSASTIEANATPDALGSYYRLDC